MSSESGAGTAEREKLVVIVPCYNEEKNVRTTVASIQAVARELPLDTRILLIDDGSTDGTRAEIEALAREVGIEAIFNERNLGVGRSLLNTYERIEPGTWVTIMPGDNEVDFRSIKRFVDLRGSYDIILGYLQNPVIRPLRRRVLSLAYMRTVQILYGFPFRYLNGMKLFRVDAFRGIEVHASGHAFNSELLAKAILRDPSLRVGEAPFLARGRATGFSKAIRPGAVWQSVREVGVGLRSVSAYRDRVIKAESEDD